MLLPMEVGLIASSDPESWLCLLEPFLVCVCVPVI